MFTQHHNHQSLNANLSSGFLRSQYDGRDLSPGRALSNKHEYLETRFEYTQEIGFKNIFDDDFEETRCHTTDHSNIVHNYVQQSRPTLIKQLATKRPLQFFDQCVPVIQASTSTSREDEQSTADDSKNQEKIEMKSSELSNKRALK